MLKRGNLVTLTGCLVAGWIGASAAAQAQVIDPAAVETEGGVGARALGMGGAFAAVSDEATAVASNPAGVSDSERLRLSAGYDPWGRLQWDHPTRTVAAANGTFKTQYAAYRETAKSSVFSHVALAAPLRLGKTRIVALAGYRRAVDLGLSRDLSYTYQDAAAGSAFSQDKSYALAENDGGGIDVFSAGLAVRVAKGLALGAVVERWTGSASVSWQDRDDTLAGITRTNEQIDQKYSGFGVRLGAMLTVSKGLRLAAFGRLPLKLNDDQTLAQTLTREITSTQSDVKRTGKIDWPATYGVGAAWQPAAPLLLAADVQLAQWSKAVYAFGYDYTTTTTYLGSSRAPDTFHSTGDGRVFWPSLVDASAATAAQKPADTLQARLGAEYTVKMGRGFGFALRGGGVFDRQLLRDAQAKQVQRVGGSAGLGVILPHATLDVAWLFGQARWSVSDATDRLKHQTQSVALGLSLRP